MDKIEELLPSFCVLMSIHMCVCLCSTSLVPPSSFPCVDNIWTCVICFLSSSISSWISCRLLELEELWPSLLSPQLHVYIYNKIAQHHIVFALHVKFLFFPFLVWWMHIIKSTPFSLFPFSLNLHSWRERNRK